MVFKAEEKPDDEKLKEYAEALGLNRQKFENCLVGHKYQSQIENRTFSTLNKQRLPIFREFKEP